jgi:GNAT superfamily N-acetyltransferase
MASPEATAIRVAQWPQDEALARQLLRNYAAHLAGGPANICIADFDRELDNVATVWSMPNGVLLLAFVAERAAGCVAIKVRDDRDASCEMKRLWVEPNARGHSLGRRLSLAAIQWARDLGANTLLLDTVPAAMPQAAALYRALGFTDTGRHNSNPVAGLQFMQLRLR